MGKPNLIFLPGALGHTKNYPGLISELEQSFTVHSIDYPGHGEDDYLGPFSIEVLAEKVLEQSEEFNSSYVFGYSMGGYIALWLDLIGKRKWAGLVTLGTKYEWSKEIADRETKFLDPDTILEKVPRFAEALTSTHKDWKNVCIQTAGLMRALGQSPLIGNEMATTTPLLILRGSVDSMVNEKESIWAKGLSNKGRFEEIENVPHPLEKVDHPFLAKRIKEFFLS